MSDWKPVATALLGSWPNQVAAWGKDAIAAYVEEIAARGLTPDQALVAIRSCPADQKFPPSVPQLAALGRRDPSRPTFDEACHLIFDVVLKARHQTSKAFYGPGERDRLNEQAALRRADQPDVHPLVRAFVQRAGVTRLRGLGLDDPEYGAARRKQLEREWQTFVEATEGREVAALASGRRGELGRLDPLAAIGRDREQIEELTATSEER